MITIPRNLYHPSALSAAHLSSVRNMTPPAGIAFAVAWTIGAWLFGAIFGAALVSP